MRTATRQSRQSVRVAIAATKEEDENIVGQILYLVLDGILGNDVRLAAAINFKFRGYCRKAGRGDNASACIAKSIRVTPRLDWLVEG